MVPPIRSDTNGMGLVKSTGGTTYGGVGSRGVSAGCAADLSIIGEVTRAASQFSVQERLTYSYALEPGQWILARPKSSSRCAALLEHEDYF